MGIVSRQSMHESKEKIKTLLNGSPHFFHGNTTYHLTTLRKAPAMASVIWEAKKAMGMGVLPERLERGSSAIYRLRDCGGHPIAVFKAAQAWNCEGTHKEISAYHLDHEGFAKVPPSVIAHFDHPLFGGLRQGVCQIHMGEERHPRHVGFSSEQREFSAASVRRVATLDIRLLNADRHTSNLLVLQKNLIPIDHTLILPGHLGSIHVFFAWHKWEEAKTPFSQEEEAYIKNLDPEKDRQMLIEELKLPIASADLHYMATLYLQLGVAQKWTAYDLGNLLVKVMKEEDGRKIFPPSAFEGAIKKVTSHSQREWPTFKKEVDYALKELIVSTL